MSDTLDPIWPGEILLEEFLEPLNVTRYALSKATGIDQTAVGQIIRGKRAITATTALKLSAFFGNSARFWLNLQTRYDLQTARREVDVSGIERFVALAG